MSVDRFARSSEVGCGPCRRIATSAGGPRSPRGPVVRGVGEGGDGAPFSPAPRRNGGSPFSKKIPLGRYSTSLVR